jgi:peptide/nickel transport system permease protein
VASIRYVVHRLVLLIPTLFGLSVLAFALVRLAPGNVVTSLYALEGFTPAQRHSLEHTFGLDRPAYVQFVLWFGDVVRGNLGVSLVSNRPILPDIVTRLPATAELALASVLLAILIGVPVGVLSAAHRGSAADFFARQVTLISLAMARFWVALLLILLFAVFLHWLPSGGFTAFFADPAANLRHLVLPLVTLSTALAAVIARMARSSMLDVLKQDYVRTARAKGIGSRAVLYRHALRNAVIPVLTIIGLQTGELLGGAIVVETIFSWPGIGSMTLEAIQSRDYPTVQGLVLVNGILFALANLAVDLLYAAIDPRVEYG